MFFHISPVTLAPAFALIASAFSVPLDSEMALSLANTERGLNGLGPLTWDVQLADAATIWASYLGEVGSVIHATEAERPNQGEVIAHYTSTSPDDASAHPMTHAMVDWLAERVNYLPGAVIGPNSGPYIHWSTAIGCGFNQSNMSIFETFVVCRISPEGNIIGQSPFSSTATNVTRRQDTSSGPFEGEITHYTTGLGACGFDDTGASGIVALSHEKMGAPSNGNPLCDRRVLLSANGRTAEGKVRDKCMGCAIEDVDVSEDIFITLYDDLGIGRGSVTWELI
ncbi:Allergen Asp f 7 like protein [Verticillium longisporum]|uniref:Allergen Asp f 7 like protein n=1 Tax=Verticillium longisporum TaxID=100787 RepID=A0A8I3A4U3_VERLO|nr:Allergen Asp f 7 like protein [Verticillium longisporum]